MSIDPIIREKKSLQLLDHFPWEIGSVIIGGYSILGYGTLRYSMDLDLVIPKLQKLPGNGFTSTDSA